MGSSASTSMARPSVFQLEVHGEHDGSINCMAVSDDGAILATGSDDCTVRLWATAAASHVNALATLSGHDKYVTCVAVSENNVYSGSADKTVKKWDMSTGKCVFTYEGHTAMVNRLLCAGELLISSSYDCTARCWLVHAPPDARRADDACVRIFRGHQKGVYPIVFIHGDEESAEFDKSVDLLITGSGDGTARCWSVETGACLNTFGGHAGPVHSLAVSSDCTTLFTGSTDGTICSWRIASAALLNVFRGHTQPVTALIAEPKLLFSGSSDRTVKSWVIDFGDVARTFKGHKHTVACICHHEGIVYTGCGDGLVRAFEVKSGVVRRVFKGHQFTVNCLKIINGKLFTGSFDNSLRVWSLDGIKQADDPYKFPKGHDVGNRFSAIIESRPSSASVSPTPPQSTLDDLSDKFDPNAITPLGGQVRANRYTD